MGTGKLLGQPKKLRESDLRWTSIPSRGSRNTETGITSGNYEPVLGSKVSRTLLFAKPRPNDRNMTTQHIAMIVRRNMLRAFGHPVVTGCDVLGVVGSNLTIFKH